jgi:hypothetical protein
MSFTKLNKGWALVGSLTVGLALWGCGEALDITGLDGTGDPINLSRELTLGELQDALVGGTARVEIELIGDGNVARRVVLGSAEEKHGEEEIESRIVGMEVVGDDGMLTMMVGGLQVTFDPETHFKVGDDEMGWEGFIDRVEGILGEGFEPWVKAWRPAPDQPQGPDVSAFHARGLRLMEEGEEQEIEINVDADNLALNTGQQDGEPDGWINVLGLSVELRVSDGITEIGTKDVDVDDAAEFEGVVHSVDPEGGTFTFTDGTLVKVTDETQIFETEFDVQLLDLWAVHEALDAGDKVVAWGGGELESKEPRVILALELRFAIHGDDGGKDYVDFEGYVTSVDTENQSFTLTNGTIVKITDKTELVTEGDGMFLGSLEEVDLALADGDQVIAWGAGEVEGVEPLTIVACEMRFKLKQDEVSYEDFEGVIESVHEGEGIFTLADGTVVHMTEETIIMQAEQGEALMSWAAVVEAMNNEQGVVAWGFGNLEAEEPLTIAAVKVWFVLAE